MTYKEILENVYRDVTLLAVNRYRKHQTVSIEEAIDWVNKRHPELPTPYKGFNGVLQATYDRTQDEEAREAIKTVFVDSKGSCVWSE